MLHCNKVLAKRPFGFILQCNINVMEAFVVDKPFPKKSIGKLADAKPVPAVLKAAPAVNSPAPPVAALAKVPLPIPAAVPAADLVPTAVVAAAAVNTPEPTAPINSEGKTVMNETMNTAQEAAKTFTADATERATAMFGDVSTRAKSAMEKGTKAIEEMVEFSKGNLEAVVASGRVAAKGAEDIAKYSAEYGRATIEKANATAKQFAAVKSPTEFFQLQSEVAKSQLDALVGEASKFTENYMKLLGEIVQPVQNRYAVAVEKVKTVVAA